MQGQTTLKVQMIFGMDSEHISGSKPWDGDGHGDYLWSALPLEAVIVVKGLTVLAEFELIVMLWKVCVQGIF